MKKTSSASRLISALLALITLVTFLAAFPIVAADVIVYGDADGDGKITARDLALLRVYLANFDVLSLTSTVAITCDADANGDEYVNAADLALLRRYLAELDAVTGTSPVVLGPARDSDIPVDGDIMNILIIGTDALTKSVSGRSDSMILVTINPAKKRIVLTSILRDLYVHIPYYTEEHPDGVWNKINAAHNFGGTALLEATIEENFGIHVDRFIRARYADFVRVYQLLGGVEISLSKKEIEYINDGLLNDPSMQKIYQDFAAEGFELTHTGELPLDIVGKKTNLNADALFIFSRARKVVYSKTDENCKGTEIVNGGDFGRTDRQRLILTRTMDKVKAMSLAEQLKLLDECLPVITTDLTFDEFKYFINHAASIAKYEVSTVRFPCSGSWDYGHTENGTSILQVLDGGLQKMHDAWYTKVFG